MLTNILGSEIPSSVPRVPQRTQELRNQETWNLCATSEDYELRSSVRMFSSAVMTSSFETVFLVKLSFRLNALLSGR